MKRFNLYSGGSLQFSFFSHNEMLHEIRHWMKDVEDCNWIRSIPEIRDATRTADYGVILIGTRPQTNYNGTVRPPRGITVTWNNIEESEGCQMAGSRGGRG